MISSSPAIAAQEYAREFGFYVFPVQGKRPFPGTKGHLEATKDVELIAEMWNRFPNANVAVAAKPSGVLILDLDCKRERGIDATDSLAQLEGNYGQIPTTPHALTPGGGFHFYFKTTTKFPRVIGVRPGVDILGDGFAVMPPSVGYEWESLHNICDVSMAPVPSWIVELAQSSQRAGPKRSTSEWDALLRGGVQPGKRNDVLTKVCGHLLRRYVDPALVYHLMLATNKALFNPSLSQDEVFKTIDSIASRELARRKTSA